MNVYSGVLDCYQELLQRGDTSPPLPQNCALQLLFDVKFLSMALSHSSGDGVGKMSESSTLHSESVYTNNGLVCSTSV